MVAVIVASEGSLLLRMLDIPKRVGYNVYIPKRKGGDGMYNLQLDTFLRVADAGSFNRAAEESYITPTAVIKQINLLEADLGVRLFDRTHRGLTLTKAGKSLYKDTKYIIRYCRDAVTRAKNAMQEDTNIIRIGTSPMTPAQLLMPLWPKIQERCPDMKFQIVPFENTPENAREILGNLGNNIDVVGGIFDETMLKLRGCAGARDLCCRASRFAVPSRCTTDWRRRTVSPWTIWTARTFCSCAGSGAIMWTHCATSFGKTTRRCILWTLSFTIWTCSTAVKTQTTWCLPFPAGQMSTRF